MHQGLAQDTCRAVCRGIPSHLHCSEAGLPSRSGGERIDAIDPTELVKLKTLLILTMMSKKPGLNLSGTLSMYMTAPRM